MERALHLPSVTEELFRKALRGDHWNPFEPIGADIGWHSVDRQHELQEERDCPYTPSGKCFYDGSSLAADEFMPAFLAGGSEVVWPMLEERYQSWLKKASEVIPSKEPNR